MTQCMLSAEDEANGIFLLEKYPRYEGLLTPVAGQRARPEQEAAFSTYDISLKRKKSRRWSPLIVKHVMGFTHESENRQASKR